MKKHSKFFQDGFFFFGLRNFTPEIWEFFLKKNLFTKYKKKFFLRKYKTFFQGESFFWGGGSESSLQKFEKLFLKKSIYQNIRKNFFWRNIKNFFSLGPESSISQNTKKKIFFRVNFVWFFKLGMKVCQVHSYYTTQCSFPLLPKKLKSFLMFSGIWKQDIDLEWVNMKQRCNGPVYGNWKIRDTIKLISTPSISLLPILTSLLSFPYYAHFFAFYY